MKTIQSNPRSESGSTLLVALIITAIMGITLASYLVMTQSQNVSVVRSQTWNAAMALTEAGIEDGLALINKNNNNFDNLPFWVNSADSDGYSVVNGLYYVKRYVDINNWGTNYYEVFISNANSNNPTITAIGYTVWKYSYASAAPSSWFAAANVSTPSALQVASRNVSVQTKVDPLFAVAMAAINKIDMNGNNVTTDSYDSADTRYSTNGQYPLGITSMVKSNGDIATDASIINSISVGNANIKGSAKTGPGGTVTIGPNGYVTGTISDDFNVQFPSVQVPGGSYYFPTVTSYTVGGKTYAYAILTSGNYWLGNSQFTSTLYVGTNINVNIYATKDVKLTGGSDEIRIGAGAQVKFYMNSASFSIKGNGVVNNNGNPSTFYYYGLPSNTSIDFGGNGGFTGAIYAPQADFSLGGGGNNAVDFIGASVTKSVKMNGHFNFHYDENLRRVGPGRGYIPTNWKEG